MSVGRPKLFFDFARTKKLDPRITFSRPGIASYYDQHGTLKYAPADTPRFEHNSVTGECQGLLVEGSATNMLAVSEQYTDPYWSKYYATVIPNATTAPDGTLTACKIVETVDLTHHEVRRSNIVAGSTTYTLSAFVKAAERSVFGMSIDNGSGYVAAVSCDLSTLQSTAATIGASGDQFTVSNQQLVDVGNGWYRLSVVIYTGFGISALALRVSNTYPSSRYSAQQYAGDPTKGIYVWGVQIELGNTLSSYIPSTQSFTSRASTATYYGSDGLIKTAAINEARMQYNPNNLSAPPKLLMESTVLIRTGQSEDFTAPMWVNQVPFGTEITHGVQVIPNTTTSPRGDVTATSLILNSGVSGDPLAASLVGYIGNNGANTNPVTASIYVKYAGIDKVRLYYGNSQGLVSLAAGIEYTFSTDSIAGFDGNTGADRLIAREKLPNGWIRIILTRPSGDGSAGTAGMWVTFAPGVTGDGVAGVYVWGAQVEMNMYATSYYPATGTWTSRADDVGTSVTTTRPAEAVSVSGTNFSTVWNASQGTVAATASFPSWWNNSDPSYRRRLVGAMDLKTFLVPIDTNSIRIWTADLQVVLATTADYLGKSGQGFVSSYNGLALKVVANAGAIASGEGSGTFDDTNAFWLGSASGSSRHLNACIQRFIYYDVALEDADLKALSKLIAN